MAQTISHFSPDSLNRKLAKLGIKVIAGRADTTHLVCVKIHNDVKVDAVLWCQRTLGDNWIWSSPTQTDWTLIYFKDQTDALAFKLTFVGSVTA